MLIVGPTTKSGLVAGSWEYKLSSSPATGPFFWMENRWKRGGRSIEFARWTFMWIK
jgi:hypothetical protein